RRGEPARPRCRSHRRRRAAARRRAALDRPRDRSRAVRGPLGRVEARGRRLLPERVARAALAARRARGAAFRRAADDPARRRGRASPQVVGRPERRGAHVALRARLSRADRALRRHESEYARSPLVLDAIRRVERARPDRTARADRCRAACARPKLRRAAARRSRHGAASGAASSPGFLAPRLQHLERVVPMAFGRKLKRDLYTVLLALGVLLWLAALLLFSRVAEDSDDFARLEIWILIVNSIGLAVLLVLIGVNLTHLIRDLRRHVPGSRLKLRMITLLVALAVTPLLIVYMFSVAFINRGIDNWFDVDLQRGLDDAITLSQSALEVETRRGLEELQRLAERLADG